MRKLATGVFLAVQLVLVRHTQLKVKAVSLRALGPLALAAFPSGRPGGWPLGSFSWVFLPGACLVPLGLGPPWSLFFLRLQRTSQADSGRDNVQRVSHQFLRTLQTAKVVGHRVPPSAQPLRVS